MPSKDKGLRIGHAESGEVMRDRGPGHALLVAPTASGKQRDILTAALLEWLDSVVVIDAKAELFCITAKHRQKFGPVIRLDPFDLAGKLMGKDVPVPASRYNPMERLRAGSIDFSTIAAKLGEGLVWNESNAGNGNSDFFTGGARDVVEMIMCALAEQGAPHEKNLNALRDVITGAFRGGTVDVFKFAQGVVDKSRNPILRQKASTFCSPDAKESRSLADILRTARGQTSFLSNEALAPCLGASDFRFADLKKRVMTVYVILPMDFLDVCARFFRIIVASALSEFLASEKGVPVLMVLDEFANLGPMLSIQSAFSFARGFGVRLWPVVQDLNQLQGLYPHTWETFLSNAAVRMFFAPRDQRTSEYLSSLCGQAERRSVSKSVGMQDTQASLLKRLFAFHPERYAKPQGPHVSVNFGSTARPLMLPHEVRALAGDEMLLFVEGVNGGRVIKGKRRPYWTEPEFKGCYAPNPYFK